MFELSSLKLSPTSALHLRHPVTDVPLYADEDKKAKPVIANLYGKASKQYREALHNLQNKRLTQKSRKETAENLESDNVEFLTACTKSIDNLTVEGKAVDTVEVIRQLFSEAGYSWVKEQIDEHLGQNASFLKS
jgi:hypothetical protein